MKLKKNGFTLIELLAVIVVLGIILVIAIPKVVDTIENSKEGANKASVKAIIKAAEQYVVKKELEGEIVPSGDINDLDIQNKSDWEGKWVNNNGIVTFDYIIKDKNKDKFFAQNVTIDKINIIKVSDDSSFVELPINDSEKLAEYNLMMDENTSTLDYKGDKEYTGPSNIIIPSGVASIGSYTFLNGQLTNVIIPGGVTWIDTGAFEDNKIENIVIPNSVTSIGQNSFSNNLLTNITIPSSVTNIGPSAFMNNQLVNLTIFPGVTIIDQGSFSYNKLVNVTIPSGVTSIGVGAFQNNPLANITIPSSVTWIGTGAFKSDVNLTIKNKDKISYAWGKTMARNNTISCINENGETVAYNIPFITGSCSLQDKILTIIE